MWQVGVDMGVVPNNCSYAQKLVPENSVMLIGYVCVYCILYVALVCGLRYLYGL